MTIAASTTFGIVKNLHLTNDGGFMACDNHLCNTLTIVDNKVLVAEVDQYNTYFATVVGINRSRGVQNSDAMLQSKATALSVAAVSLRDFNWC